jgi:hypothetical protein
MTAPKLRVPLPDTPWTPEVVQFALSYNGYDRHGDAAAEIGNRLLTSWNKARVLPSYLPTLRCALFFEQRRAHHTAQPPEPEYLAALLAAIHRRSGGWVDGPADPRP